MFSPETAPKYPRVAMTGKFSKPPYQNPDVGENNSQMNKTNIFEEYCNCATLKSMSLVLYDHCYYIIRLPKKVRREQKKTMRTQEKLQK